MMWLWPGNGIAFGFLIMGCAFVTSLVYPGRKGKVCRRCEEVVTADALVGMFCVLAVTWVEVMKWHDWEEKKKKKQKEVGEGEEVREMKEVE
jgi:hypothetical protein